MRQLSKTMPPAYKIKESNLYNRVNFYENIVTLEDGCYSYDTYSTNVPKDIDLEDLENYSFYLGAAKVEESNSLSKQKIRELKNKLDSSDYQVIKCTENFMLGSVLPYDFSQLLAERSSIRDKINGLENNEEATEEEIAAILLEAEKNRKIMEMSAVCQTTITNGIDYNEEHYRLNTTDQINLTSLYALAQAGQSVPYHADGQVCRIYSAEEMIGLVQAGTQWIMYHTTYFNLLKHQILEIESVEEIEVVEYGMELKEEYQSILNSILGGE